MGLDHELRVGKAFAQKLLGDFPLPRMGYETDVLNVSDEKFPSFKSRLVLQNISGIYMLASPNCKRSDWERIFKVTLPTEKQGD